MQINAQERTITLSMNDPMTLPALVSYREHLIDQPGFRREDVRMLNLYIDRMTKRIGDLAHDLDVRRTAKRNMPTND